MGEIVRDRTKLGATNIKGIQVGTIGVERSVVEISELLRDCVDIAHDGWHVEADGLE